MLLKCMNSTVHNFLGNTTPCGGIIKILKVAKPIYRIYPHELQLNKDNASDTKTSFLDLHFSISNGLFHPNITISGISLILT